MPIPGVQSSPLGAISGPRITLAGVSISDLTISPTNASATLTISSDGTYSQNTVSGGTVPLGDWVSPALAASQFEYKATELSGTVSSGTIGSWVTGTQAWTVDRTTIGTKSCALQIEVRPIGGPVVKTTSFGLSADKEL